MLDEYKVFVRGSTETKKILGEIAQKRNIHVNNYEFSDKPRYQFGKCPIDKDSFMIWYTNEDNPTYFVRCGYKEVTPQQFREIWLGKESLKQESKSKDFCCKGCEKLREVCQRLAKEGFVNSSETNFEKAVSEEIYFFEMGRNVVYYSNSGRSRGEIVSPEEFYERIAGKPWEEKKKIFIGFLGDSNVNIGFLPTKIKNPKHLKGNARNCIFYVENDELTYCPRDKVPADRCFIIVSYSSFLIDVYGKSESGPLLTLEDYFELKQETKETNSVQSFVKNSSENFLNLSEEKPLKIIL